MAEQLNSNQVLLLNNLLNMHSDEKNFVPVIRLPAGTTVGEYVTDQMKALSGSKSAQDIRYMRVLQAIQNDPQLCSVEIAGSKLETTAEGGGKSALFVQPNTKEAVVVYSGTMTDEWKTNFIGGGKTDRPDGVSTISQEAALKTFQEYRAQLGDGYTFTVTGHSNGGNKAKYITVMDDSVDHCFSYDGQGFSDNFMEKYEYQIAMNQGKIQNHNVSDDPVNMLLNDIGTSTFYVNQLGGGNIGNAHLPEAYFHFGPDGAYTTEVTSRPEDVKEIDRFFNSLLRSLPEDKKAGMLEMLGDLADYANRNGGNIEMKKIFDILLSGRNTEYLAYMVVYIAKYEEKYPGLKDALESYLGRNGLGDVADAINGLASVVTKGWFKLLLGVGTVVWNKLPLLVRIGIKAILALVLGKYFTEADLLKILFSICEAYHLAEADDFIVDNGEDISYDTSEVRFLADCDYLDETARRLQAAARELESLQAQCRSIAMDSALDSIPLAKLLTNSIWFPLYFVGYRLTNTYDLLNQLSQKIGNHAGYLQSLSGVIREISDSFRQTEASVAAEMQF